MRGKVTRFILQEDELDNLSKELLDNLKPGAIVFLQGELGAGKTSLVRSLIRNLLDQADLVVSSPTYTLLQQYSGNGFIINHLDLYRLDDIKDFWALGVADFMVDGITIIEWPQLVINELSPNLIITIDFIPNQPNQRKITLKYA